MAESVKVCPACKTPIPNRTGETKIAGRCHICGHELPRHQTWNNTETVEMETDPLIGKMVHGCRIEGVIGKGAMSTVYKARKVNLDKIVALKVFKQDLYADASALQRFQQEAKIIARFKTPYVVSVFDVAYEPVQRIHYLELEFVDGQSLQQYVQTKPDGKMSAEETLRLMEQAALALAEASRLGVVHRDIKPDNLLLDEGKILKIADFGISKMKDAEIGITTTGQTLGTPVYASPEQCKGESPTSATDMYSLGASFYYLLTGEPPATASSYFELINVKMRTKSLSPLKEQPDLDVPVELSKLIEKMTELDVHKRFQDFEALATRCREIRGNLSGSADDRSVAGDKRSETSRKPLLLGVGAIVIGLAVALTIYFWPDPFDVAAIKSDIAAFSVSLEGGPDKDEAKSIRDGLLAIRKELGAIEQSDPAQCADLLASVKQLTTTAEGIISKPDPVKDRSNCSEREGKLDRVHDEKELLNWLTDADQHGNERACKRLAQSIREKLKAAVAGHLENLRVERKNFVQDGPGAASAKVLAARLALLIPKVTDYEKSPGGSVFFKPLLQELTTLKQAIDQAVGDHDATEKAIAALAKARPEDRDAQVQELVALQATLKKRTWATDSVVPQTLIKKLEKAIAGTRRMKGLTESLDKFGADFKAGDLDLSTLDARIEACEKEITPEELENRKELGESLASWKGILASWRGDRDSVGSLKSKCSDPAIESPGSIHAEVAALKQKLGSQSWDRLAGNKHLAEIEGDCDALLVQLAAWTTAIQQVAAASDLTASKYEQLVKELSSSVVWDATPGQVRRQGLLAKLNRMRDPISAMMPGWRLPAEWEGLVEFDKQKNWFQLKRGEHTWNMVLVKSGKYITDELSAEKAIETPFLMDVHEVTVDRFEAHLQTLNAQEKVKLAERLDATVWDLNTNRMTLGAKHGGKRPVCGIGLALALHFARANRLAIPTADEWLYAASRQRDKPEIAVMLQDYPWVSDETRDADMLKKLRKLTDNQKDGYLPVVGGQGKFLAPDMSPWGVWGMFSLVSEWTVDKDGAASQGPDSRSFYELLPFPQYRVPKSEPDPERGIGFRCVIRLIPAKK